MNSHVAVARPREVATSHLCQAERLDEETKALALEISRIMIQQPATAEQLVQSIQEAEVIIDSGLDSALAELNRARLPASRVEVKSELAMLVGAFPNSGKNDLRVYGRMLVEDVAAQEPSAAALSLACRGLRRTARFVPTIAEVLEAIARAQENVDRRASTIRCLRPWLERALEALPRMQERERLEDERIQRGRQAYLAEREKELADGRPF